MLLELFLSNFTPHGVSNLRNAAGLLNKAYTNTYLLDDENQKHRNNVDSLFAFFGIPNRMREVNHYMPDDIPDEATQQLASNFVGWHHKGSPLYQKRLNYAVLKPLLMFLWNLLLIPVKTVWNTLTLVTEFLPFALKLFMGLGINNLFSVLEKGGLGAKVGAGIGLFFLVPLYMITNLVHGLGRCLTSPTQALKIAWKEGNKLEGLTGNIVGGLLALTSLAVSITLYSLLFPLAINVLVMHAPLIVANVVIKAVTVLANIPGITSVSTMGFFLAGLTLPMVTGAKAALERFSNWWYRQTETALPGVPQKSDNNYNHGCQSFDKPSEDGVVKAAKNRLKNYQLVKEEPHEYNEVEPNSSANFSNPGRTWPNPFSA